MKPDQQAEIVRRLRSASGHLKAIVEMTETGQPCEQVLHQLNAVQAALHVAGIKLINCQVRSSQSIILDSSSAQKRIAELKRLQSLYIIFLQYPNHHIEVSHD